MDRDRQGFLLRTVWPSEQLEVDRLEAIAQFRRERLEEPLEAYLNAFERFRDTMDNLLEGTVDLTQLESQAVDILTDPELREGFRYLTGPPISLDDLKTLADTNSIARKALRRDPELVQRIVSTVITGLDRRRFPWVTERREPSAVERQAAVIASAALLATRRVETERRTEGKKVQEEQVRLALRDYGLDEVARRHVRTMNDAPTVGAFCREAKLGSRKADLIVRLWDARIMPIECKVSNSSINSIKRLNNDAAAKAEVWLRDFGSTQVVPVAILSGVYKLHHLEEAQTRGLTLYWAHRLSDLVQWIQSNRDLSIGSIY